LRFKAHPLNQHRLKLVAQVVLERTCKTANAFKGAEMSFACAS
jgi:hypothetical protein